jgi:hypothetical protein
MERRGEMGMLQRSIRAMRQMVVSSRARVFLHIPGATNLPASPEAAWLRPGFLDPALRDDAVEVALSVGRLMDRLAGSGRGATHVAPVADATGSCHLSVAS